MIPGELDFQDDDFTDDDDESLDSPLIEDGDRDTADGPYDPLEDMLRADDLRIERGLIYPTFRTYPGGE